MGIRRRTFLSTSLAGVAPAIFSAPSWAAGVSSSEIVLGTDLDLAGAASVVTPTIRSGIQMRIDEANEAGGIHGRKLRLIVEDNSSLPSQAVRAVDKLIQRDKVFAIVCPFGSGPGVATAKRIVEAGVVDFGPFGASTLIKQAAGPSPLLFTLNDNYDTTTFAGVKWAINNFGSKKVGYIYQEGPFGDLVGRGLKQALAAKGIPLAAQASYRIGDIDFSSQVARMKAADVDLIVTATVTRETIAVMGEVKKLGWGVKVLTSSPGRSGLTTSIGKGTVEGLYGVGTWKITPYAEQTGALKAWSDNYRTRFHMEPDDVSLIFYDYTSWFLQGVEAAGRNLTTDSLVKALQASSFKGQSSYATQRFKDNHIDPEWIRVEQVEKGVWRPRSEVVDPAKNSL